MAERTRNSTSGNANRPSAKDITVQNEGRDYHFFLLHSRDNYTLAEALQEKTCRQNAASVHIVIENGQRNRRDPAAFGVFLQAVADLPHLEEVSIAIHHSPTLPACVLTQFLRCAPHLQVLKLQNIDVEESPYVLVEVLKNHPSLHTVHLIRCHCRPVHVLIEALSAMKNLRTVRLDGDLLGQQCDVDARAALSVLCQSSVTTLVRLELVHIPEVGVAPQLLAILEALQQQQQQQQQHHHPKRPTRNNSKVCGIQELSIQVSPHGALPMSIIQAVGRMLARNRTLKELSISWMGGVDMLLPIVEEGLSHNSTLKEFRLDPRGMDKCYSHSVTSLSSHVRQRTAAALRCNTSLTYLWFDSWLNLDLAVDLYLSANALGRGYLLQPDTAHPNKQTGSYEAWMKALMASRNRAHLSFYWLSHNPCLLQQWS